jgi:DNA-binding transcriptional ArsR family regulator
MGVSHRHRRTTFSSIEAVGGNGLLNRRAFHLQEPLRARAKVKRLLKAELRRAGVSYRELAERLRAIGVDGENQRNISNKISRGGFTAAFLLQCMQAIGAHTIHLDTDR